MIVNKQKRLYTNSFYLGVLSFIFIIISYKYWDCPPHLVPKIGQYAQILSVMILFVTGLITIQTFMYQLEDRDRMKGTQYVNMNQGKIADIDKMFMSNPYLDRLYFQMYAHDPTIQKIIKMRGPIPETAEILKFEHQASNMIFQKIADVYACEKLDDDNDDVIEWINEFRGWMRSPLLKLHWKYLQYEQHPDVRRFVDDVLIGKNDTNSRKYVKKHYFNSKNKNIQKF